MSLLLRVLTRTASEPFTSISRQVLRVYNHGSQPVAFKVKTTAPKLYCVRPNSGKVDPGSSVEVSVLLQPMKEDPPLNVKCKDKFLVQSTVVPHGIEANDVWGLAATDKSLEVHQQKLKVAYLPAEGALQEEDEPEMHQLSMMSEADSHRYETVRQAPNGTGPTEGAPIPVFENEHDTAHHRPHTPDHAEFSNAHEEHEILPTAAPIPVAAPTANSTVTAPTAPSAIIATPPRTTAQAEYDPNYALKLAEANAEIARLQALLARNNDQTLKRRTIFSDDGTSVQDGITEIGDDSASVIGGGSVIGARSEGVPLNVVAILSLLVFVVTYLFF